MDLAHVDIACSVGDEQVLRDLAASLTY